MIIIDVVKLFEESELYCVIITRYDTAEIRTRATLAVSMERAKEEVEQRRKTFEKADRKVSVRWHLSKEV